MVGRDISQESKLAEIGARDGGRDGVVNLFNYTNIFAQIAIAIVSFVFAAIALVISPVIPRMMHEIR